MVSERTQRQVNRLLDEAEAALAKRDWQRVRDLAGDTLALDPSNADARSFLAAADRALASAATPAPSPANVSPSPLPSPVKGEGQKPAPTPPAPAPPPLPATLGNGRYAIKRMLGEGGKKKVYLARDTTLDRDVAFALIKAEGLDEVARARILREAQVMARLSDHPNIMQVYDLGAEPDGQPYMVLPLMPGGDVEGLIKKAPDHKLPMEQALRLAIETASGLEFAHARGIVHRDLKPGNVWLTSSPSPSQGEGWDGGGTAKIGDFGLALPMDRSRMTREGMMVGTVAYMPPEQAMGGEITPRADLYSLGAMLYEMVCGRPPFVGDDSIAIIGQHINTPPVAPTWHRPDCPPALETLILRLLEKDATKRPASAKEVREALESVHLSLVPSPKGEGGDSGSPSLQGRGQGLGNAPGLNPIYRRVFVGRETELRQLHAAFDAALSGQGGLSMVVGEPGIGKTAVIEQLATYVALRGGKALIGHCYEEGSLSLPYLAFVEAMRSYVLARDADGLKKDLGTGAADVARIVSEVRDKVTVELRQSGEPEDDRWRLYQGITTFLKNASSVQPLLIVLEDLHWADKGTLDLLVHLARNFQGVRLLIVGTYRDVEVDRSHPLSGALGDLRRGATFQRVPLRGLTAEEVQRMMSAIAGQEIPNSLAEAVHRQTEGNPLFIQEVLRYLVEEGMLAKPSSGPTTVGATHASPLQGEMRDVDSLIQRIPEGLRDVIGKRLARLSAECNRILSVAAVIGRDFRLDVLQLVAGISVGAPDSVGATHASPLRNDPVEQALEEAQGVGVIETQRGVGGMAFRFTHAYFRQTLYEETFAPRRIRLHQQVARALERIYARRLEEHAAELAEHFTQSTDTEDLEKALRYGEMAAQRALGVYAYGEAAHHLERCLQVQEVLDPDDRAKRIDLLLALGEALLPAGEPRRAYEDVGEKAFALAEAMGDRTRSATACEMAVRALFRYGAIVAFNTPEGQEWARRADRMAAPGSRQRVWADIGMGISAFYLNRLQEQQARLHQALEQARRLHDPEAALTAVGVIIGLLPLSEAILPAVEELYNTPAVQATSYAAGLFFARVWSSLLSRGQQGRAEAAGRRAAEINQRLRDPQLEIQGLVQAATELAVQGKLEQAEAAALALLQRGQELGSPGLGALFRAVTGFRPSLWLGHVEATMAVQQGVATATRAEYLILCLAHLGRRQEAQRALRQRLEEMGIGGQDGPAQYTSASQSLEAAVLLGDRETAALLLEHVTPLAGRSFVAITQLVCPARVLGDAAALLGEPEQARAYYMQALENCAKIGFRPEAALAHLGLAELGLGANPPFPLDGGRIQDGGAGTGQENPDGQDNPAPTGNTAADAGVVGARSSRPRPQPTPADRAQAIRHLDIAIREFMEMKMQPSLERALKHREILRA